MSERLDSRLPVALAEQLRALDPTLAAIAECGAQRDADPAQTAARLGLSPRAVEHATRLVRAWELAGAEELAALSADALRRVRELFEAALDLPLAERAGFARMMCADAPAVLDAVAALLAADGAPRADAARELAPVPATAPAAATEERRVAGYRILRELGRGGMGCVYEAEQERPRRKVALKMLDLSLATPALRRRFEVESEILAALSHPGVARVYESGVLVETLGPQRRELPWFAMEYVEGARELLEHAREAELDRKARLQLFLEVCEAVQHGHQLGVIHRDLKSANILVDLHGHPRVIDFGVARVTARDSNAPELTAVDEVVGSMNTMAPEQLDPRGGPPDVRVDVYALGVVLYELMCGAPPYELSGLPAHEAARIVREVPPRPPRASGVHGDLEVVLLKALEKDPARRYPSVEALAADIERVLAHEPVRARRAGPARRARAFVRRHPAWSALAAMSVLAAIAIVLTSARHARDMERAAHSIAAQRDRAEAAERAALAQLEATRLEAQKSEAVRGFLEEMLGAAHPERTGRDVRVADLLELSAPGIEARFADFPEVRAALHRVAGATWSGLGLYEQAARELETTRALLEETRRPDDPETLAALEALAYAVEGLGRFDEAEELLRAALERRLRALGGEDPGVARAEGQLATLLVHRGRHDEAQELFRGALAAIEARAPDDAELVKLQEEYAQLLLILGRADEAEPLVRAAVDVHRERHGPRHPRTLRALSFLATLLAQRGAVAEAIPLNAEIVGARLAIYGETHALSIAAMQQHGDLLRQEGRLAEAAPWLRRALDAQIAQHGEEHPDTPAMLDALAALHQYTGELAEAEALYRRSLLAAMRAEGAQHPRALLAATNLAGVLWMQGRAAESEPIARDSLAGIERSYPPEHPFPLAARSQLASILASLGERDEAEEILWGVLESQTTVLGETHPDRLLTLSYLGRLARQRGALEEAEALYREAYERQRERYGVEHVETLASLDGLVHTRAAQGAHAEASALAAELLAARRAVLGEAHADTRAAAELVSKLRALEQDESEEQR